ncbi:MAG: hypothetical protein ACI841_000162 [Planctomycetota bacterium]|jgi:hypothetical protein
MHDTTCNPLLETLFAPSVRSSGERVSALASMMLDLTLEVEALRRAHTELSLDQASADAYKRAYREVALQSHNSMGISSGSHKLISQFYPAEYQTNQRAWKECMMIQRLGCTAQEFESYKSEARVVDTDT